MTQRLLIALFLLASTACAPWLQRGPASRPLPLDGSVRIGELENGLRYYIRVNREPQQRAELRLVVNAGSVLEDESQRGLAHMVEHMAFNGTRNFEKQALVQYLEGVGMRFGPDVNAYTSFDETVYMLTLPTDSAGVLETGMQILEDWAHGVAFDSLEVEKERGVVIEEWRMGQGASSRLQEQQFPVLFRGSRYAERLPIGTRASLERATPSLLKRFYRDWYRPDLMAVVAVGDFDPERMEALIRRHFGSIPSPDRPRKRQEFGVPGHEETVVSVATDPEATGSTVSIYLKRPPRPWETEAAYREWIVESLASGMLTNRLSERIQRPNAPLLDVSSFQGRFIRPLSAFVLAARVPENGIERGLEELLVEIQRARRHGFTDTELEREKREVLRRMEQRYAERDKATSAGFASEYVSHFLYGGVPVSIAAEYELYRRLVPEVELREVNAVADQWASASDRVILATAPQTDSARIPEEGRLEQIVRATASRAVPPYEDAVSEAPLVSNPPTPGTVVAERKHGEVGVVEWELSNGVRVLLKPTDFREDEVLLVGRSPGGTSLVSDADFFAATTASAVVQAGGLGELNQVELRKRLSGRVAGVGADISEQYEGLSGAASPRDLETLFQLVYLKFTAPRLDSAAIEVYRAQAKSALASRAASPEQAFADTLRVTLTQHHPRARPLRSEMFDRLEVERSFAIYRDRFADASDFTFYLVGAFDPDSLRPLVTRYLGGLPSLGRVEQGRDVGIRPPTGVVRRTVRRGMEPKAVTQIVFSGGLDFSRESIYSLNALASVLQLRLRESLREELGGTYNVSVRAGGVGEPRPRYQLAIGFGADPERIPELTRATFALIDSLRTVGPLPADVQKVREMGLRERETDLRTNRFWIAQLLSYDQHGWALPGILEYPAWAVRLDADAIRAAAARYLDAGNYVQVTLLPETTGAEAAGAELSAPDRVP